jgi:hypothetical protein
MSRRSRQRHCDKIAGFHIRTSVPTASTAPIASSPIRRRVSGNSSVPIWPKLTAAETGAADFDDRVSGINDPWVGNILDTDIAGAEHYSCTHSHLPLVSGALRHRVFRRLICQSNRSPCRRATPGSRYALWLSSFVAPCRCFSFGGHQTTSPARISVFEPPSLCTHTRWFQAEPRGLLTISSPD